MKVLLACFGSFGDVKPFLWMAKDLMGGGHEAVLIANPHFRDEAKAEGVPFRPAGTEEDYRAAASPAVQTGSRLRDQGERVAASRRLFTCMFMNPTRETYEAVTELKTADTAVVGHFYAYGARLAAEKHGLPYVNACLSTYWLREFSRPDGPAAWLKKQAAAGMTKFVDGQLFANPMGALRAEIGLKPLRQSSTRWMFSENNLCLLPEWLVDFPLEDIGAAFPGFPQGIEEGPLPPPVEEFLGRHPSPIVFTPGTAAPDASAFFSAAQASLTRLGRPGIFLTRSAGAVPENLPDTVIHAGYVPLGLLLGRSCALVHQGGIGTAARALEAGIPQLLCPRMAEGAENARELIRLGVGAVLPQEALTPDSLHEKMEVLLGNPAHAERCAELKSREMNMPAGWLASYLRSILKQN